MQDDIGAESKRVLVNGCSKGIVHHQCTHGLRGETKSFDVNNLDRWVGRGFQIQQRATRVDFGLQLLKVTGLSQADFNIQRWQKIIENLVGASITVLNRNHPVARLEKGAENVTDRRHSGRETGG